MTGGKFLDALYKLALGAALMCAALKWGKGLDTGDEFWAATVVWVAASFAKMLLEKKTEARVNG